MSIEVKCINKSNRQDAHERILNIGGVENAQRWKMTQQQGITATEAAKAKGQVAFFVNRGGHIANVIVAVSRYGNKYLKTEADGEQPDNLLSLPECP